MSYRFVLGAETHPWADSGCAVTGAGLRAVQSGPGPFKLMILPSVPWEEIADYFAEEHVWPSVDDFWVIYFGEKGPRVEHPTMDELLQAWETWRASDGKAVAVQRDA